MSSTAFVGPAGGLVGPDGGGAGPFINPAPPPPVGGFNLYRGRIVGVSADRQGSTAILTLDLEDSNRQFGITAIGRPLNSFYYDQSVPPTRIYFEPAFQGLNTAGAAANFLNKMSYMPGPYPANYGVHMELNDVQENIIDYSTTQNFLKDLFDDLAAHVGGQLRYWIDPDTVARWTLIPPADLTGMVTNPYEVDAPFKLVNDAGPWPAGTIMPGSMKLNWDWKPIARSVFVNAATSDACIYVAIPGAPDGAGDVYVQAPGVIDKDTALAVANWHIAQNFRELLTGTAIIEPGRDSAGTQTDGWRVGQTLTLTDSNYDGFVDHEINGAKLIIQKVSGKTVGGGSGIGVTFFPITNPDNDFTSRLLVDSFSWEEIGFGQVGKATLVIKVDATESFSITKLAEVLIRTDGTADIQYSLEFGDIPAGDLGIQLAKTQSQVAALSTFVAPIIYHFNVSRSPYFDTLPVGQAGGLLAQCADYTDKPVALINLGVDWTLLQWQDGPIQQTDPLSGQTIWTGTIPGDGYSLATLNTVTDKQGRSVNVVTHDFAGTATWFQVKALALPIP